MISVSEATNLILGDTPDFGTEEVDLLHSVGRILRSEIKSDRDLPPFDRVTMDGICISHTAWKKGIRKFPVSGIIAAGDPQSQLLDESTCMEIMTGAILPKNVDAVIRYEDVEILDGVANVNVDNVAFRQNIHAKGSDRKEGDLLLKSGKKISAAEINVLATTGYSKVSVSKNPKFLIISSGDELVDIRATPKAHQIRRSNIYGLAAMLQSYNIAAEAAHIPDDKKLIEEKLRNALETFDVLVLSGGVSKGKYDFIPEVLEHLGVQKLFHKIKQRPGKPFWYGRHPGGTFVFALPGNPVSSFLCTYRYLQPWLNKCLKSHSNIQKMAELKAGVQFSKPLTYFAQVKLSDESGVIGAHPIHGNGSGDLASLVEGDAFMELPADQNSFAEGDLYPVYVYRSI